MIKVKFKAKIPEYLNDRCCLCPNVNVQSTVCPGEPGTLHPDPSPCRFVKMYVDERGWNYKVMGGIGCDTFKARYQKPGSSRWQCTSYLPWRNSFDEAQEDLNKLAKKKQWEEAKA